MKVMLPVTSTTGKKVLTPDQRNLLVILEDATVRFVRDEIRFLRNLNEVKSSKLAMVYLGECLDFIDSRVRQIRREFTRERADEYEDTLLVAVDMCDPERNALHKEIKNALLQKVGFQHIQRAEHIAVAGGLVDSAARIHEWLTGKVHKYDQLREKLGWVDERIGCMLLNAGKLPDMGEAQKQFGVLFDKLCTAVLENFTHPADKVENEAV